MKKEEKMSNFKTDARQLLDFVGGKENIKAVTHCVTRMRFVLIDPSKADPEKIEKLPSVKGSFTQAGQFQVIIGNRVQDFYNDFMEVSGMEGVSKDAVKEEAKSNQNIWQRISSNLAEVFAPLIPAIIVGGLILGFRNIIGDIGFWIDPETGKKTVTVIQQYPYFWKGLYDFLWLIGEAIFHFLPVGITWSITRKMGTTQILGIVLGITLVSPQLLNAYGVTGAEEIPFWDFGFAKMNMIGYQAQVIPAMLAGFSLAYLERFFKKIIPEAISMIFVPFFSLIIAVIISHAILGPIGWVIGDWIAKVVYGGLTSSFKWLFAGVFGFLYAPLVITGLHHTTNAIDMILVDEFGGTLLWPMIALSNIAQGSAALAVIFLNKKDETLKQVAVPATISAYLGVTEPAMFGVNLKYSKPFLSAMIGSSIAAVFSVASGVMAAGIGVGGLPGILSIIPSYWGRFLIAMLISIVVPFILTIILSKKERK